MATHRRWLWNGERSSRQPDGYISHEAGHIGHIEEIRDECRSTIGRGSDGGAKANSKGYEHSKDEGPIDAARCIDIIEVGPTMS